MAYVLSSVSGNLISAASAGYAPTNSGDVSAIASSYQVVSSTATQLYAGTAYVTSINEAPVSAARAGNAANASMATSAYYDGTGRLISALPDSAAVSAIASSYVESGVSSKQDTLSFAYNTADQISSINGSALGGMDEAAVSGIASAYAESAVSSKADSSALSSYALSADVSGTVNKVTGSSGYWDNAVVKLNNSSNSWNSAYDTVTAQSANWGGSALALSAGPGVKLEKVGNTLVASTDETVLWSGSANTTAFTGQLSEAISHFQYVDFYAAPNTAYMEARAQQCTRFKAGASYEPTVFYYVRTENMESNVYISEIIYINATNGTAFTFSQGCRWNGTSYTTGISAYRGAITKIVGINRTAEA